MKPELLTDPYESFMQRHLRYYGYYKENNAKEENVLLRPTQRNRSKEEATDSDSDRPSSLDDQKSLIYSLLLESAVSNSRQLVFDQQEGQVIPRLSEPRDLFSTSKRNGLLKPPRWPTECEVIPERVSHIEWGPPDPEPFYRHTGTEAMPRVSYEGEGKVVYEIGQAYKGSYFTGSRTGGRRCANNVPTNTDGKNSALQFESRFESGNLQKAVQVGAYEYELTLRTDLYSGKHTQWFYFQVKNTRSRVSYRFTITNLMKKNSLYNAGMKPLMYSEHDAGLRGEGWRREGGDIRYYRSSQEGVALYCLTWTFQFPHDNDTCYFAHCYPYTYSDLSRDLQRWTSDPARSQYCKLRALCRSLAGNTVYLLTITSPSTHPALVHKKAVVVTARVHPGETNGSWMMRGFLDFILSDSLDAQILRDTFVFKVVPMLNPDGVIVGNYRCSLSGRDLNRYYRSMLKDSFPCIWHMRAMVKRLLAEREVLLYCDFHGHSRKNNVFMYGCNNKGEPEAKLHERVFPLMLSKNAPDQFFFKGCKFKVQKSKEGTGRVVMWRSGIRNSYTMEATFGGSTLGDRKGTHFTSGDLKLMGHHFCDTLLDYCDPDNTKFKVCLSELHTLVREEIKEKLKRLGREVDSDVNLSDISLSDIESSTSGSNSSESDGLPAHLLHIANKFCQKKKRLRSRKERNHMYQKGRSKHKPKSRVSADITEPSNQTAKPSPAKSSGKEAVEKRKTKSHESSLSHPDGAQTVQAAEKPILSFTRKPEAVPVKTQLINRLPTSFVGESAAHVCQVPARSRMVTKISVMMEGVQKWHNSCPSGDFSSIDHVCPHHAKSREPAAGNRLPLIITVIQKASLPAPSKDSSSIKQHPPPFHAMLDYNGHRNHVSDHVLKREKSFTSRSLIPAIGTKPYSFASSQERQKHMEPSTVDLQLSLSPAVRGKGRVRQEPLIALVTTDYLENLLSKPKKDISASVRSLPNIRKCDSFPRRAAEDTAISKPTV